MEKTFIRKTLENECKCCRSLKNRQAKSEWLVKEYVNMFKVNLVGARNISRC